MHLGTGTGKKVLCNHKVNFTYTDFKNSKLKILALFSFLFDFSLSHGSQLKLVLLAECWLTAVLTTVQS